ncbi:hypothetical protein [Paenibacillus sp. FSL L8-0708]|uniref:hypothetical protein n=1 Tax=Paenibacillus sp. FSL L8-0708 TaxID=2975311 RepID=UPI0030FA4826
MRNLRLHDLSYVADLKSRIMGATNDLSNDSESVEVVVEDLKDIIIDFIEFEKSLQTSFVQEGMLNRKNRLNADTLASTR